MDVFINIVLGYFLLGAIVVYGSFFVVEWRIARFKKGKLEPKLQDLTLFAKYAIFKSSYTKAPFRIKTKYWVLILLIWLPIVIISLVKVFRGISQG